jgi:hypothetical protein
MVSRCEYIITDITDACLFHVISMLWLRMLYHPNVPSIVTHATLLCQAFWLCHMKWPHTAEARQAK